MISDTKKIEFPGIDAIINNADYYKNIFIEDGIVVFRNANLSYEEHEQLHFELGKKWNFYNKGDYTEDHSRNKKINIAKENEILLTWHQEHVYYKNPIVIGTWNMHTFNLNPNQGNTYFIDMSKLYKKIPDSSKEFLSKCVALSFWPTASIFASTKLIEKHWITEDLVLRLPTQNFDNIDLILESFDNRTPTVTEIRQYILIVSKIWNSIKTKKEPTLVHRWNLGDLVIPDMFKMCHAVTGGFDPKDRVFNGMWGYRNMKENNA